MRKLGIVSFILFSCLFCASFAATINQAELYHRHSSLQWQWAMSALEKNPMQDHARVLDVGCGDGKITAALAEILPEGYVIGLDLSPQMIAFASKTFTSPRNLLFLRGDARALPFDKQFDWVVSFCTQHWILEQEMALRSMHESLVEGGKILIVTLAPSPNNLGPQCQRLAHSEKWSQYFPNFKPTRLYLTATAYRELLQKTGFDSIVIEETPSVTTFANREAFRQWLKPLVSCSTHLAVDLQEAFLTNLVDLMLQAEPPAADGTIDIHDLKLEITAQKSPLQDI